MSMWPYRVAREQRAIRTLLVSAQRRPARRGLHDDDDDDDYNPDRAAAACGDGDHGERRTSRAKVDEYRLLLGDPRNGGTVVGPAPSGRREVNWEGVNGANLNSNAFPADFFAKTTKLGLQMSTPGTGLRVSDNDFSDVNAAFGDVFNAVQPDEDVHRRRQPDRRRDVRGRGWDGARRS